jgi:ACS family glucarate transporter-like MFS transporter
MAPIVTGYLVNSTGSFTIAFIVCGVLAVLGAVLALVMTRGVIGAEDRVPLPVPVGSVG